LHLVSPDLTPSELGIGTAKSGLDQVQVRNLRNSSGKYTPFKPSIEEREERRLEEMKTAKDGQCSVNSLKDENFVSKSIFEQNLSPQLMTTK
jgi:hypothetical protein